MKKFLGELFSYFILETVIIGKLIKVNPLINQAVEQVKIYTKNYLVKDYQILFLIFHIFL